MMIPLVSKTRSRTPKSLPKPGSRFKRMKRKLQLKVRDPDVPIDPQIEDDIEVADPLEAPPKQLDDAPPPQPDDQALNEEHVGQKNKNKVLQAFFMFITFVFSFYYM